MAMLYQRQSQSNTISSLIMVLFLMYLLTVFELRDLLLVSLKVKLVNSFKSLCLKEMLSLTLKNQKMQIQMRPVLQVMKVLPIMKFRLRHQKRLSMMQKCKMLLIGGINIKHLIYL